MIVGVGTEDAARHSGATDKVDDFGSGELHAPGGELGEGGVEADAPQA